MTRRLKQFYHIGVVFVLALVLFCGTATTALSAEGNSRAFDFGLAQADGNEIITPSALFTQVFDIRVSEAEATYLDGLSEYQFLYSASVPDHVIATNYDKNNGVLTVSATSYSYVANNGATVIWMPIEATIGERVKKFEQNGTCAFENLFNSEDFDMHVAFSAKVELDEAVSGELLNEAFEAGSEALAILRAYEEELARFEAAREAYLAYEAYLQAVRDYDAYLDACRAYDDAMVKYRAYLDEYAEYTAILQAYEDWRQYYEYQEFLVNGLEQYNAYLSYKKQVEKVEAKLAVMETLFVTDSHGWQLYGSLMGNTVTSVVERKSELVAAGCAAADIDAAGKATVVLRRLMEGYADIRGAEYASEHERLTALYGYYTAHYTEILSAYQQLYTALNTMYTQNPLIASYLDGQGKLAHFQQFMGQLYITTTCLDDNVKQSADWTISKNPLHAVVEAVHRVSDTNSATPGSVSMPQTEVPAVENVEPIDEPTVPDPIHRPTEPPKTDEPIKPATVENPDDGIIPPYAEDPEDAPAEPSLPAYLRQLANEIANGTLKWRQVSDVDRTVTLYTQQKRHVSIENKKVITFYDSDRKTVLHRIVLEYGEHFSKFIAPDKEDAQYRYTFRYWVNADGSDPEIFIAYSDMSLYAYYDTDVQFYDVTWVVHDYMGITKTVTERYAYDLTRLPTPPISDLNIAREPDAGYTYEFSGWDHAISPVTGNVTYTASVKRIPKLYTITWVLGDREVREQFPYGSVPTFTGSTEYLSDYALYAFVSWQGGVKTVSGDATYVAEYKITPLAVAEDGTAMRTEQKDGTLIVYCTQHRIDVKEAAKTAYSAGMALELRWESLMIRIERENTQAFYTAPFRKIGLTSVPNEAFGVTYAVSYISSNNAVVKNIRFPVTVQTLPDANGKGAVGYLWQNGEWIAYGKDAVVITGTFTYRVCKLHTLTVNSVGNCNLAQLPTNAEVGQVINLRLGCKFGYEVSAAVVTLSDGTLLPMIDGLSFVMPDGDVNITLTVSEIVYRVTFVANGVVLSEREYRLGEEIEIPLAPEKPSDEIYEYVFAGWSQDATIAIGSNRDLVYEAIYTSSPINSGDPYQSGHNNNVFLSIVLPILLSVLGVVAIGVVTLVLLKKKKIGKKTLTEPAKAPNE